MSLVVKKLNKSFGGVTAVKNCSFTVKNGSITGLIGPNGAGKTTIFNLITGLFKASDGDATFKGEPLLSLQPFEIARLGIARTYQMLRIFPELTALENLMLAHPGRGEGIFDSFFRRTVVKEEERTKRERAKALLKLVTLEQFADTKAGALSYGQQKLLDIARCLATEAELLLLDEPVAGVNPTIRVKVKELLKALKREGKTIVLIEHDMSFVMDLCDEIVVLDHGVEIAIGPPSKIKKNKKVINAYLGVER
jgi:branched-chain amino acid transport system ATP-binding protein